jgi:hypothetical protein
MATLAVDKLTDLNKHLSVVKEDIANRVDQIVKLLNGSLYEKREVVKEIPTYGKITFWISASSKQYGYNSLSASVAGYAENGMEFTINGITYTNLSCEVKKNHGLDEIWAFNRFDRKGVYGEGGTDSARAQVSALMQKPAEEAYKELEPYFEEACFNQTLSDMRSKIERAWYECKNYTLTPDK